MSTIAFDAGRHEADCLRSFDVRTHAWETLGTVEPDLLSYLMAPTSGPRWPNGRRAFRVIRGPLGTTLATDGLSDPYDDYWDLSATPRVNGRRMEVYAIADTLPEGPIAATWLFHLVVGAAFISAKYPIAADVEALGTISTEFYDIPIPEEHRSRFLTERDTVGALLGFHAPPAPREVAGPLSAIRLVNVLLLTRDETSHVIDQGDAGRAELVQRLQATPAPLVSSLTRPSLF